MNGTIEHYSKDRLPPGPYGSYRKKTVTEATLVMGRFVVETREGLLEVESHWVAIDAHGYPYPIAPQEFDMIYEAVE